MYTYCTVKDGAGTSTVTLDTEDLDKILSIGTAWKIIRKPSGKVSAVVYSAYNNTTKKGYYILLHRVILAPPAHLVVDHINSNPLDNRKENLRVVTTKQNSHNINTPVTNTSGALNVYWRKERSRWIVQLGGKRYGSFINKEDAMLEAFKIRALLLPTSKEAALAN